MFNFPSSPTVGQSYTPAGGPTYLWDGFAWAQANPAVDPYPGTGVVKVAEGTIAGSPTVFDVPLPTSGFNFFELWGTMIIPASGGSYTSLEMQAWYGGTVGNSANNYWTQDSILANNVAGAGWNATSQFNITRMLAVPFVYPSENYGIFHMRFPLVPPTSFFTFINDSQNYGTSSHTRSRIGGGYFVAGTPTKLQFFWTSGVGFVNGGKWQLNGIK